MDNELIVIGRFPEITGKDNFTVFSYSGRVKSPEWRRQMIYDGYMQVNRIQNTFVILKIKRHFVQKAMCFIQKDDGDIIHDSNLITQEVKTFCENLYASRENNTVHCNIDNINTPTLSQEENDSLEGPITLQQALSSIK